MKAPSLRKQVLGDINAQLSAIRKKWEHQTVASLGKALEKKKNGEKINRILV